MAAGCPKSQHLRRLIQTAATEKQQSWTQLKGVLDDNKLQLLVDEDLITDPVLCDASEEELRRILDSLGAAKSLKRLFPSPAAGAGAAPAPAPASPLMRDELARGMVDMTFQKGSNTTHSVAALNLVVQEWELDRQEVIAFAQAMLGDATLPAAIRCGYQEGPVSSEGTTNYWVRADAMERINTINRQRNVPHEWVFDPGAIGPGDNIRPDFVYKHTRTGKCFVPAEGKYWSVIPYDDLLLEYNSEQSDVRNKVRHVLSQEVGYIRRLGALHGVITTQRFTFVLQRQHVDSLCFRITKGYRNTQTQPSVAQVLFYVGEQEVRQQAELQASQAPQQWPVPASGVGGSSSGPGVQGSAGPRTHARVAQQRCAGAAADIQWQATDARPADHLCNGLQLLSRLAVGQCGTVYLGSLDGHQVVVESADAANAPRVVESLQREAAAYKGPLASLCGHFTPHLLYDGFTSDGLIYTIVTSFIDGVHPDPPLPDAALYSAAQALGAVHSAGLAHGDMHDNNIIVQGDKAFLIDFGECYPNPGDDQRHEEMAVLYEIFGRMYQGGRGTRSSGQSTGSAEFHV